MGVWRLEARFLGEPGMNILDGRVENGRVRGAGFDAPAPSGLSQGQRISIGIRPEDLAIDSGATPLIRGTVRTLEYLGGRCLLRVDVADGLISAFLPPGAEAEPGAEVGLAPSEPGRLRYFDTDTGLAVPARADMLTEDA